MKLLFDARYIKKIMDGFGRYSISLITELNKINDVEVVLLVNEIDQAKMFPNNRFLFTHNKPTSLFELFLAFRLNRYQFDAYFSPVYFFGGFFRKFKVIATVHDFIAYRHTYFEITFKWRIFYSSKWFLKQMLNHCDAVATVSETVKKELVQLTDRPVQVISNSAIDMNIKNCGANKNLLYIGRYERYKNVEVLIQSMDLLKDYTLLLVGHCEEWRKCDLLSKSQSRNRIQFLGKIKDHDYFRILESCFALVMPSTEEGFGLPVIEAMKAGCPVICSNIPVFHEIASQAALFFNNANDLARQVKHLESPEIRQLFVERALINAQKFSWEKSAKKLVELIYNLSNSHAIS